MKQTTKLVHGAVAEEIIAEHERQAERPNRVELDRPDRNAKEALAVLLRSCKPASSSR